MRIVGGGWPNRFEIFVVIAIDRCKRAGDPSIKLVDHDPVRIRMNI